MGFNLGCAYFLSICLAIVVYVVLLSFNVDAHLLLLLKCRWVLVMPNIAIYNILRFYLHYNIVRVLSVFPASVDTILQKRIKLCSFKCLSFVPSLRIRFAVLGAAPYNAPGHVPELSHWIHDVVTYQYCCLWSNMATTCGMYMDQRPTRDCKDYDAAQTGRLQRVMVPQLEGVQ